MMVLILYRVHNQYLVNLLYQYMIKEYYPSSHHGAKEMLYCLSPTCKQTGPRIFSVNHHHTQNINCQPWIASYSQLAQLSFLQDEPFNFQRQLKFKSEPLQTQAYLHYHQKDMIVFIRDYMNSLREQILLEFDSFTNTIEKTLQKMFKFNGYGEIMQLLNEKYLSNFVKEIKLKQMVQQDIFKWEDYCLPSIQLGEQFLESIKLIFQKFSFILDPAAKSDNSSIEMVNAQRLSKSPSTTTLDKKSNISHEDMIKEEHVQSQMVKAQNNQPYIFNYPYQIPMPNEVRQEQAQRFHRQRPQRISNTSHKKASLQQFISETVNLNTIIILIDQGLERIYFHDKKQYTITINCPYCAESVKKKCSLEKDRKDKAAGLILNHLYHHHFAVIQGNYDKTSQQKIQKFMVLQKKPTTVKSRNFSGGKRRYNKVQNVYNKLSNGDDMR